MDFLSKSQIRNAHSKHTVACLTQGIVIAAERRSLYESMEQLLDSGEAKVVLDLRVELSTGTIARSCSTTYILQLKQII